MTAATVDATDTTATIAIDVSETTMNKHESTVKASSSSTASFTPTAIASTTYPIGEYLHFKPYQRTCKTLQLVLVI